ncbi:MAG TPA: Asp-tRNA(Asn)/Glu-tRNA(Gln) amidotransferase subunit GatC [Bryobacteraceae bacterium]|nr:Asp-tRNA(Asn)/Glu-tRNA(Gln) amidotransferase subunit GatC [Bryobacteraceae bacterium]
MKITEEQVRYVADLANLSLTAPEIDQMAHDLTDILTHMEKLNELNTSGVEPMAQVLHDAGEAATLRPDREKPPLSNREALANAPASGNGYFKVPRVIER